jgi:hypothetical protein
MKSPATVDLSHRLLHRLGWSVGEARFKLPNGSRYWQVDAARDGHVIIASAYSQAMAWRECCRMARVIQRDGQ